MEIESGDTSTLQIANLTLQNRVIQDTTVQDGLDNIFVYLNLSDSPQEREGSYDIYEDTLDVKTKKDNYIIKKNFHNYYQCGYCGKVFSSAQSLGGHVQKNHRTTKNRENCNQTIQLRQRPTRFAQH
ncbi:unnamed protein product [Paramecium octaurelia]|uniref:C2H2-type domain-containing protein n=1 Tax=Paramecium octaurelia TaxID=43137 RepID=A0A8S1VJI6_PAROT|nr:unnamed protein product [Paramecium octaurelia]